MTDPRDETGDIAPGEGFPRVALVWPGPAGIGMASLGFHLVRQRLQGLGCRVERAFCEARPVRTVETNQVVSGFDALAFSVAFELDFPMLLEALDGAGLALLAARRSVGAPLVVVGGAAVTVNRHPVYPFADVLVSGEGEDALDALAAAARAHGDFRTDASARRALYERLSGAPGVEVTAGAWRAVGAEVTNLGCAPDAAGSPDAEETPGAPGVVGADWEAIDNYIISKAGGLSLSAPRAPELPRLPALAPARARDWTAAEAVSRVVTDRAELGRRMLAEIARGCPYFCGYCWLGWNCREFSPRPAARLLEEIDAAVSVTRCDSVGLVSAAVGAHPEIDALLEGLLGRGMRVSFSSLRAEELSPLMLEALVRSGQRGLTLAPESGNARLRKSLGKPLEDAVFFDAIERAQEAGLADLKLYFMTGLPGETGEDAESIAEFVRRARDLMLKAGRPRGRLGTLSVNLGIFVPKPGTPLARRETPPPAELKKRAGRITRLLAAIPNVRAAAPSLSVSQAESALSNGGLETARLVYEVWHEASARSRPPRPEDWTAAWRAALKNHGNPKSRDF